MTNEEYEFHIDAFTPTSIPMARLAQYLTELALLLGNQHSVHFKKIKSGSVGVVAIVEREAIPKVRARLQGIRAHDAPDEVRKHYRKIDEMLRTDNASGKLARGTSNVIKFPGKDAAKNPRMGPFTEQAEIDGKIMRVGGTDDTAHALIEDADGNILTAECSRELAAKLAPYLYGAPVRLIGTARSERNEVGEWKLLGFRAKDFKPLDAEDLATAVGRLRKIDAGWKRDTDPVQLLQHLRGTDREAH